MAYNGWTNYETWAVNLWLDNEPGTYEDKRDIIRRANKPYEAEQALKEWVVEMTPDLGASLWADLLNAALGEVNWSEIVNSDWDDLHEDEDEDDDDA